MLHVSSAVNYRIKDESVLVSAVSGDSGSLRLLRVEYYIQEEQSRFISNLPQGRLEFTHLS